MRIGILTSGGDCPGLNAVIRGVGKYLYNNVKNAEIVGIADGYGGLIHNESRILKPEDFVGILNLGGTILGTSRQPFKLMTVSDNNEPSKLELMVANYKKMNLDCLLTLGGAGTHKTAALLSAEGLNVIGLPKTIDNDIYGTDVTFGFHTAVDVATDAIDRVHTTAASHGRTMLVEIMGNKVGWLTLYAGLAGGADMILLPEIPFDKKIVADTIAKKAAGGKAFNIIAIAEGAMSVDEAAMSKKERSASRSGSPTATKALAEYIGEHAKVDTRVVVPGHMQRGGNPSAYDRVLSTQIGGYAGRLVKNGLFGVTVAIVNNKITYNQITEIAGKTKFVPADGQQVTIARGIGVSFGDK